MSKFYEVSAGSGYGRRDALYEVIEGILVLRYEGDDDSLAGNDQACDFEGLTLEQAKEKARAINDEPVGHEYDGCHACNFYVKIRESEPPDWYTYQEPKEADVIRRALADFRASR